MLLFIAALVLVAVILEWFSLKDPLSRMRCQIISTKITVDPDEPFELVCSLENTGRLPMSWVRIQLRLPAEAQVNQELSQARGLRVRLPVIRSEPVIVESSYFLLPRQKLISRFSVSLPTRGRFIVARAHIQYGDFFGFETKYGTLPCFAEVVALPRRAESTPAIDALGGVMGDMSVRRFIMEDPVLTLGFREYTGTEPQKMISWTQSARYGRMMVKKYDYTIEPAAAVILNVDSGEMPESTQLIERCFSLTRSVCEALESQRIKYSFLTNATAAGAFGLFSSVTDGLGSNHILAILEGLGRATYDCTESAGRTLERAARSGEQGRCHIVITLSDSPAMQRSLRLLREHTGGRTFLITAAR